MDEAAALDSEERVLAYLRAHPPAGDDQDGDDQDGDGEEEAAEEPLAATRLSGGMINYVWRVQMGRRKPKRARTDEAADAPAAAAAVRTRTVIVKYFPDHMATNAQVPFSSARFNAETQVLRVISAIERDDHRDAALVPPAVWAVMRDRERWPDLWKHVGVPAVLASDAARRVMVLQDLSADVLDLAAAAKAAKATSPFTSAPWHDKLPTNAWTDRVEHWAERLGEFIALVHVIGRVTVPGEAGVFARRFAVPETAQFLHDNFYKGIVSQCESLGFSPAEVQRVGEIVAQRVGGGGGDGGGGDRAAASAPRKEVLLMGDLWMRSVLVKPVGPDELQRPFEERVCGGKEVFVIDWEFARPGHPGEDLGFFAAQLIMAQAAMVLALDRPRPHAADVILFPFINMYDLTAPPELVRDFCGSMMRVTCEEAGMVLVHEIANGTWGDKADFAPQIKLAKGLMLEGRWPLSMIGNMPNPFDPLSRWDMPS